MAKKQTVWERLAEPFRDDELGWRVMQCGKKDNRIWAKLAAYVDSRAIMNRLDTVVGPGMWQDEYRNIQTPEGPAILCKITIHEEGGVASISKEDGADFNRGIETAKSGISDSFKRAANKFGMGRHLYAIGETWANDIKDGYPPKGVKAVRIYSKEHKISHWCPAPTLNGNGGAPPATEPDKPQQPDREKVIAAVVKLEVKAVDSKKEAEQWRFESLDTIDLKQADTAKLVTYGKRLDKTIKEKAA